MEKSVLWYFYAKMEQLKRMDEIQTLAESDKASEFIFTDSDGNVIVPDGNETL